MRLCSARTAREGRLVASGERRRFLADDYERIGEVGVLTEDDRVELIAGVIVDLSPLYGLGVAVAAGEVRVFGTEFR